MDGVCPGISGQHPAKPGKASVQTGRHPGKIGYPGKMGNPGKMGKPGKMDNPVKVK